MLRLTRRFALMAVATAPLCTFRTAYAERPWIALPSPHMAPLAQGLAAIPLDLVASHDNHLIFSARSANGPAALYVFANGGLTLSPVIEAGGATVSQQIAALSAAPDGTLWAVLEGGNKPRLVSLTAVGARFQITRNISLDRACAPDSRLTSVAVHGTRALVGDAGRPALITVNLTNGTAQRVLEANPALVPSHPIAIAGQALTTTQGIPSAHGARLLLSLSPDGAWVFFQTTSGPLYRIERALLDDPNFSPIEQLEGVVEWRKTPSLSALAIAPDATLLMADMQDGALMRFTADRIPQRMPLDSLPGIPVAMAVMPDGRIALATAATDQSGQWHGPADLWAISLPHSP